VLKPRYSLLAFRFSPEDLKRQSTRHVSPSAVALSWKSFSSSAFPAKSEWRIARSVLVFDKHIRVLNNLPVRPREEFSMRRRNRDRGFTLIELLIVVTIILIIAAFTIPKITKAQIPAHEASAIASIKAINAGQMIYSSSHPDQGFTADLAMLGGTSQSGGEQTIDTNLASGRKSGYTFTYTPGEKVNGAVRSYTITAVPDQVGSTGQRRFFSDESGEIHYNSSGPADATSPVIQ
jgi:type IV pilus assembly protein PilA